MGGARALRSGRTRSVRGPLGKRRGPPRVQMPGRASLPPAAPRSRGAARGRTPLQPGPAAPSACLFSTWPEMGGKFRERRHFAKYPVGDLAFLPTLCRDEAQHWPVSITSGGFLPLEHLWGHPGPSLILNSVMPGVTAPHRCSAFCGVFIWLVGCHKCKQDVCRVQVRGLLRSLRARDALPPGRGPQGRRRQTLVSIDVDARNTDRGHDGAPSPLLVRSPNSRLCEARVLLALTLQMGKLRPRAVGQRPEVRQRVTERGPACTAARCRLALRCPPPTRAGLEDTAAYKVWAVPPRANTGPPPGDTEPQTPAGRPCVPGPVRLSPAGCVCHVEI